MLYLKLFYMNQNESFPFYVQYGKHDNGMEMHIHEDFSELVIVVSGSATHIVGNEKFHVKKGDVFVMGQGLSHGYTDTRNFRIYNLMFRVENLLEMNGDLKQSRGFHSLFIVEPYMNITGFKSRLVLSPEDFAPIDRLVKYMLEEYDGKKECREAMIASCFTMLAVTLSRMYESKFGEENESIINIASTAVYMEKNFGEAITIQELADISHYSIRHFIRLFKETYHTTPQQYLLKIKMTHACFYLKNSDVPIIEVAHLCGFSDSNYFSNAFKKYYGMSPTQYRNEL